MSVLVLKCWIHRVLIYNFFSSVNDFFKRKNFNQLFISFTDKLLACYLNFNAVFKRGQIIIQLYQKLSPLVLIIQHCLQIVCKISLKQLLLWIPAAIFETWDTVFRSTWVADVRYTWCVTAVQIFFLLSPKINGSLTYIVIKVCIEECKLHSKAMVEDFFFLAVCLCSETKSSVLSYCTIPTSWTDSEWLLNWKLS